VPNQTPPEELQRIRDAAYQAARRDLAAHPLTDEQKRRIRWRSQIHERAS